MPKPNTSIDLTGIATVLSTKRLEVPVHQRSFEWGVEVQEFLEDIGGAFGRNGEEYFLGSLVITGVGEGERPKVLDGQQRLATVSLLLAGIADEFNERGDKRRGQAVQDQYLATFDIASGTERPQLKLNQADDPYFRSLLKKDFEEPGEGAPESHRRLYNARMAILQWLKSNLKRERGPINWLAGLSKYLEESAYVVYFTVPDDANAYLIFETMNDRGLDLSIADLLKNCLLGRAGDDLQGVLHLWTEALTSLRAYGGENLFSVFLRHFWSSKYEVIREKDLYRNIKSRIVSAPNVMDFAVELERNSNFYAAILSPEHEFWAEASVTARDRIRTLLLLGLEQYRPMLVAVLAHLKLKDIEDLLRLLISWNVRLLIVGGLGGGVMERHYAELGQAIRRGELKSGKEIATRAIIFVLNDAQFRESFASARVSKVSLARYYLRVLERQASGESQPELIPNIDPGELTLDHVLPDRTDGNWPQFSEEDKRAYLKRIGNMVLLAQKMNSVLRSSPFQEKKKIYAPSKLGLTAKVARFKE